MSFCTLCNSTLGVHLQVLQSTLQCTVCFLFQMYSQIACLRGCIVTLVAFVWLFSTMCLNFLCCVFSNCLPERIYNHIGCACFTFSTMCFQMCRQIACMRGCKTTLVALFYFSSTVSLQMACPGGCIITMVAFAWLFSHCVFLNVPSNCLHERRLNHNGSIFLFFSTMCFQMHHQIASKRECICYTGCICVTFLCWVFSYGPSNVLPKRIHNHTDCICFDFSPRCFLYGSSNRLRERTQSHIGCIWLPFFKCVLKLPA